VASRPSEPVRSSRPSEPVRSSRPSEPVRSSRPSEPLRSNARQNRERILAVAHEALIASSDASLNSIAKRAGVGIATVYRHFPTREALVLEVYRHEVTQLAEAAPALLASNPPLDALRKWMDRLAHYGMTKAGLAEALNNASTSHDSLAAESYGPVIGALSLLLKANEEAGTIRPGLDPDDVLLILGFLWRIDPKSDWRARADRLLGLLMDGLRAGAPGPAR
jgi:AcrR family transcriptional regulator